MAEKKKYTNQEKLDNIHWFTSTDQGREWLLNAIAERVVAKLFNTPIERAGVMGGVTSVATSLAYGDDHTIRILDAIAGSGGSIEDIQKAVKEALAEGLVKVDVTVNGAGA